MRVLYIVPNPPSQIRVRPFNLIKGLRMRGHSVTIATTWSDEREHDDGRKLCLMGFPVITARLRRPSLPKTRNVRTCIHRCCVTLFLPI